MTPDLTYLVYTAVLCLLLWVPYIVGVLRKYGGSADDYRDLPSHDLPPFLKRAYRAHINLVENLPVFAVLVLVAHVTTRRPRRRRRARRSFSGLEWRTRSSSGSDGPISGRWCSRRVG